MTNERFLWPAAAVLILVGLVEGQWMVLIPGLALAAYLRFHSLG